MGIVAGNAGRGETDMDRDDQAHELAATARSMRMLAGAALIVALTGPMWVPGMLASLNFRSQTEIMAEQNRKDLQRLEEGSAATEQRLKATETAVASLRADLGKLEAQMAAMRDSLAAGAAANLAAALRSDSAFMAELASLRAVAAPPADLTDMLTTIAPYAAHGIPSALAVRQVFLIRASQGTEPPEAASPFAWFKRAMMMAPPPAPVEIDPNLQQAETALRDDDIGLAIAAVRRIENRPDWMSTWLSDAAARSAADALLPRLDRWTATAAR
jgi:uncharacterized coiled-coil protein SlyX